MAQILRVAFTGAAGTGKSTHARLMQKQFGGDVLSFATPLKKLVEQYYLEEQLADPRFRRQALQTIGQTMRSLDPNVFIRQLVSKIPKTRSVYIDDLRYKNELEMLRNLDFVVVRLTAPLPVLQERRPEMGREHLMHQSETELAYVRAQLTLATDLFSIEDIHEQIVDFLKTRTAA